MLDSIAESLEFEAERALERLVTLLEPVLIILMAVIIGFVVVGGKEEQNKDSEPGTV